MCNGTIRDAEREFARALWNENIRLKRTLAEAEQRQEEYFAEVEVHRGIPIFYDPNEYRQKSAEKR